MNSLVKLALFPVSIVSGAISFLSWSFFEPPKTETKWSNKKFWGWLAPEMDPIWAEFKLKFSSQPFHQIKNLVNEWNEMYPKRGYKALSFLIVLAFLKGLLLGIIIMLVL
jgi:hypothetical protein